MSLRGKVAIVGMGMIPFGEHYEKSFEWMLEEAYLLALKNTPKGIDPDRIQAAWLGSALGDLMGTMYPCGSTLTANIGLGGRGIPCTQIVNGCPTGSDTFRVGAMSVASGAYDVVLVVGAEKMRDKPTDESILCVANMGHPFMVLGQAYGTTGASLFASYANAHMAKYGTTKSQMAKVAVKNHYNGSLNPDAHHRMRITEEQVLKSPLVASPFNVLDCCPQTDGAAAAIIVRADLAKEFTDEPIYLAGFGCGTDYQYYCDKIDWTEFYNTRHAGEQAYKMAGIGPEQIDLAEVHDCFTFTEITTIESLGFVPKGEGGKAAESGLTALDGKIPVSTSGGLLSKGHPLGATGVAQLYELWEQLRGRAGDRQVKLKNGYGLQQNIGGMGLAQTVVTILSRQP
jgi:acetyl-CoA C-acetyltransferase